MNAQTRKISIVAGILLVVLLLSARVFRKTHPRPIPPAEANNALNPYAQPGALPPGFDPAALAAMGMNQVAMYKLVGQGIPMGIANYLTQAKAQVLGQTSTSAHFVLSFTNDLTSDETITLTPNQQYTPTPAELPQGGQRRVYNIKFSVQNEGPAKARISLQYFVPYGVVPADLQRKLQSTTARWFDLVPSAWAQEGGGSSMGMNVASDTTVEVTKEVLKQTAEHGKLSQEFPTPLSRLVDILNAFKKEQEHVAWLDELAELQDCAENPTNPLTQKAFDQDPKYRDQVVNGVNQARADVTAMTGMRFLNLATSVATDLVEGPLGAITSPISSFNDESLKELAENRVKEAGKGIVPCHNQPIKPGHFRPLKGTLEYKYKRAHKDCSKDGCSFGEETRLITGTFVLNPDPNGWGVLAGEGSAMLDQKINAGFQNPKCSGEDHSTLSGPVKISAESGGMASSGVVKLTVGGDNLEGEERSSQNCGAMPPTPSHWSNGGFGISCEVGNLDLVQGGGGSGFVVSDQGYGTCKIEVAPQ